MIAFSLSYLNAKDFLIVIRITLSSANHCYNKIIEKREVLNMEKKFIKNIAFGEALTLESLVEYQEGRVVSLTLVQNDAMSMTLFAFAQGEGISTHSAPGDALVYIIDGQAKITIGDKSIDAKAGQTIVMPSNVPHGLDATENFKMLLVVSFK
jgi:quercetin dioxygenase-like cupin family protein